MKEVKDKGEGKSLQKRENMKEEEEEKKEGGDEKWIEGMED